MLPQPSPPPHSASNIPCNFASHANDKIAALWLPHTTCWSWAPFTDREQAIMPCLARSAALPHSTPTGQPRDRRERPEEREPHE